MRALSALGVVLIYTVTAYGQASSVELTLQTPANQTSIIVGCGAVVTYHIMGHVVDTANDGLSVWGADLVLIGPTDPEIAHVIPLTRAAPPGGPPMSAFVVPDGVNNPNVNDPDTMIASVRALGYGGTPTAVDAMQPNVNRLVQLGGGQNSIRNDGAGLRPYPAGDVIANVAQNARILAVGSVSMPLIRGDFTLRFENAFANVFQDDALADPDAPFFKTAAAVVTAEGELKIKVVDQISANPPAFNPYSASTPRFRDVLQDTNGSTAQGIGASGTPAEGVYSYAPFTVTFCGTPIPEPSTSNISVSCTGGTCPSVSSVSGLGTGPYSITLSGPIPVRQCTTFDFASGQRLQYQNLPGDVNMNGTVTGQDNLALITALNNGNADNPVNLARYDINRNGTVTGQDVIRLIQLINGGYNNATVAACP